MTYPPMYAYEDRRNRPRDEFSEWTEPAAARCTRCHSVRDPTLTPDGFMCRTGCDHA